MKISMRKNLFAAALLVSATVGAIAQGPAPAQVAPAPAHVHPHHAGPRDGASFEERQQLREQRMARRLSRFKQTLQITAAQEGAWTAWVGAMKPQRRVERPNFVEFARMTTPQRIDTMRNVRAQRMAEIDRRGEATKAFYASLSAEQKKVFDEQGLRFAGGRGGKRGGHGGHHGHRG